MNLVYIFLATVFFNCNSTSENKYVVSLSEDLYSSTSISDRSDIKINIGENLVIVEILGEVEIGIFKGVWYKLKLKNEYYYLPSFMTTNYSLKSKSGKLSLKEFAVENNLNSQKESEGYYYSKEQIIINQVEIPKAYYIVREIIKGLYMPKSILSNEKIEFDEYTLVVNYSFDSNMELQNLELSWLFDGGTTEMKFEKINVNDVRFTLVESGD